MRLVRIAPHPPSRKHWDVLAVPSARGDTVLEKLLEWSGLVGAAIPEQEGTAKSGADAEQKAARDMIALLRVDVPTNGPRPGTPRSRSLRDQIFEFCFGPRRGKKLRVTWFYGGPARNRTVICFATFFKREATPRGEIERASKCRRRYLMAEASGEIEVADL